MFRKLIHWNVGGAFLFFAAIIIIAAILVSTLASAGLQANLLMWTTAAAFLGIAILVMFFRAKELQKITFSYKKMHVVTYDFDVKKTDFKNVIDDTIQSWSNAIKQDPTPFLKDVIVEFKEHPVKHPQTGDDLNGYVRGNLVVVGYKPNLDHSALAHEIGHVIYREWSGSKSLEDQHRYIKRHNLR